MNFLKFDFSVNCLFGFIAVSLILLLLSAAPAGAVDDKIPFLPGDSIAEIEAKIAANGYNFKVAPNWITRLPEAARKRLFSRRMPVFASFRQSQSYTAGPLVVRSADELPDQFDWRDFQGHSYIGPIRDQESCGACYAFGACAAAEGSYNVATGKYDGDCLDLSEAFLAFCLDQYYDGFSGCDGSDYDYEELDALVERGVCREESYPYKAVDEGCVAGSETAPRVKYAGWYRVPCGDIAAIKSAIMTFGVVDAAVKVTSAFAAYAGGIYADENTECDAEPCSYAETNHCIALVGWQDTSSDGDGYWILRNSWGTSWGEDGYMRIAYRSAHVACAVCYVDYVVPVLSQITGAKWNDYDGDGVRDSGEPGLSHWKIFADLNQNQIWDSGEPYSITDPDGNYTLADLSSGTYAIKEELQDGWHQTLPATSGYTVVLGSGETVTDKDFGNHGPSATDTVKIDWPTPVYDTVIQRACNSAADGDSVLVQIGNYNENLDFADESKKLYLYGGFDSGFSNQVGMTNIIGQVTISGGTLIVERLTIK